jgi:hypothetical protein
MGHRLLGVAGGVMEVGEVVLERGLPVAVAPSDEERGRRASTRGNQLSASFGAAR